MLKKKVLSGLLAIAMVFGSAAALPEDVFDTSAGIIASAAGDIKVSGDYKYKELTDGTVEITGYIGTDTEFSIPYSLDRKKVSSIGDYAFQNNKNITSVCIGDNVKRIGKYAFNSCINLSDVVIWGGTVESIGDCAFMGCSSLKHLKIPKYITTIGNNAVDKQCAIICEPDSKAYEYALHNGNQIEHDADGFVYRELGDGTVEITKHDSVVSIALEIPSTIAGKKVTSIGENAISGSDYEKITIPDSITNIGKSAFLDCPALRKVIIPNSVKNIGNNAFDKRCTIVCKIGSDAQFYALYYGYNIEYIYGDYAYRELEDGTIEITAYVGNDKTITIPSSISGKKVTIIGDSAFFVCQSIESVTIPNSVTKIGYKAFLSCISLKNVTIPSSVTYIGQKAFRSCISLTSVTIPDSVTSIGAGAFYFCTSLKSVTIPNSVTYIFYDTLCGCTSLESVTIPNSVTQIGSDAFNYCLNLKSVTIPNSVTSIFESAFEYCSSLESVTIPNSVTEIHRRAFYKCSNLKSVTISDGVTSIDEDAFSNCTSLKSVTIPKSVTKIDKQAFGFTDNEKIDGFTVKCYKGTAAETYAKDNGFKIVYLGVTHVAAKAATCTADGNIEYWKHDGKFYSDAKLTTEITQVKTVVKATGHKFSAWKTTAFDVAKGTSTQTRKCSSCGNTETQTTKNAVSRFAGAGRYETAAKISQAEFIQADTVVLAYSMNYADALAGVPLAKAKNAPILLTNKETLDKATLAEIKCLKAKNVIILGGTGAISTDVENSLRKEGLKTERFAGETRYGTATAIAEKLSEKPTDIFFVFGGNYPDALSASAAAAAKNAPIIYLTKDGELNADTAKYLAKLKKAGSVKNAYVIGGTGVISDDMMKKAGNALGVAPTRLFGANRFETCIAVNEKFAGVLNGNMLCVATGMDFPDALAGGVYAAINKAPLFLVNGKLNTPKLTDAQKAFLKTKAASKITVFGGTGAVSDEFVKLIANAGV